LRRPERQLLADCLLLVALGFLMVLGSGQAAGRQLGLLDLLPLLTYAASTVSDPSDPGAVPIPG